MGAAAHVWDPRNRLMVVHAAVAGLTGLLVTGIWVAIGAPGFWPIWVWFGLALAWGLHVALGLAWRQPPGQRRVLAVHGALSLYTIAVMALVWLLADRGDPWPVLPAAILLMLLGSHAVVAALWRHLAGGEREQQLEQRVDVLTRTRRGALEVQDAELRRVERDLHDGAQSRLVALTMQLGRAEERLADQPEAAELVRAAREEAGAAIRELRDLARGIAPPVLADRGLAAALEALAQRSAVDAQVRVAVPERPPAVLETAAYFVVAEALTNVTKHAEATAAWVDVHQDGGVLVASVSDDGAGGADPAGSGLLGLRGRVEAVDGTLAVTERPGGGTIVRAELPCER